MRRDCLSTSMIAAVLVLLAALPAAAQDYPSRPIHVVVGFPAGSGADIGVRFIAGKLADVSGATIVVENKPGAGSNIAIGLVAKARPDGYTVLFAASSAMAGSRYLYKDFTIDTEAAFEPSTLMWRATFVLTVKPGSPLDTVDDLTRHLKSREKALHAYTNQTGQLAAAYYLSLVGARSTSVSYRTAADAVADLASGTIDFMMLDGSFAAGQYRAGRIKPLAVTTAKRASNMPTVPTMEEAGLKGFQFAPFWAAFFPKGTPPEINAKMNTWLLAATRLEATREQWHTSGSVAISEGPEATRAALKDEIAKWAAAVKAAGLEPQ